MQRVELTFLIALSALLVQSDLSSSTIDKVGRKRTGLPDQVVPELLGVNIHFTGDNRAEVEQIAAGGFRFIRMDFHWSTVEKEKGRYDFTAYDGLMTALDRSGIRALFILDYGNPLYDGGFAPRTAEGRKAFAAFAAAAAAHFKGRGILWEIWNEPNGSGFWRPHPNAEHYALLARETAAAIRKADPDALILGPALAGMDWGYLEEIFKHGLLDCIDVLSVHPYRGEPPETAGRDYQALRRLIARYAPKGRKIPIVSGEWGYTAAHMPVLRQAQYLARQFLSNMMNDVRLSIWYDWRNDGPDPREPEHNFGTTNQDGSPKPAYIAAQVLTTELAGCRFVKRLYARSEKDYILLFEGPNGFRIVAWTLGDDHQVDLPLDLPSVDCVSMLGERSRNDAKDGKMRLTLLQSPCYLEVGASTRLAWEKSWRAAQDGSSGEIRVTVKNPQSAPAEIGVIAREHRADLKLPPGRGRSIVLPVAPMWDGRHASLIEVSLAVRGIEPPFVQNVEFDASDWPTAEPQPGPGGNSLCFAIRSPRGEPLAGKLKVDSAQGISIAGPAELSFQMADGERVGRVCFPLSSPPAGPYTISYSLTTWNPRLPASRQNRPVLRVAGLRFVTVSTFSTESEVQSVAAVMDGDQEVPGSASIMLVDSPGPLPGALQSSGITRCARIDYRFGSGWKFVRISPTAPAPIQGRPIQGGIWVYGDGSMNIARCRFTDSSNQTFQPDFGTIDWTGWRYITAPLDGSRAGFWGGAGDGVVHYPIRWNTFFLIDSRGKSGTIYLGPMVLIYLEQ